MANPKSGRPGAKFWGADEVTKLVALARGGMVFADVAVELGRSKVGVASKFQDYARQLSPEDRKALWAERDANLKLPASRHYFVSAEQLADRAARMKLQHQSLTAEFFGDPLPGRSALDQRSSA